MVNINLDEKLIRSKVIKAYLGNDKCFCFSCGNATKALQNAGVNVIAVSPKDAINATRYVSPLEATKLFNCFDATPGNLPIYMIKDIAAEIKKVLPRKIIESSAPIYIPTGSGETLLAMSFIFPISRLRAVVDIEDTNSPIFFSEEYSPLFHFIRRNFQVVELLQLNKATGFFISKGRKNYQNYQKKPK